MPAILRRPLKIILEEIKELFCFLQIKKTGFRKGIVFLLIITIFAATFPCAFKVLLYPAFREVLRKYYEIKVSSYYVTNGNNIKIFYKDTDSDKMDMIKENAEECLDIVLSNFNYKLDKPINIVIYPEQKEMENKIGLWTGGAAMGVYYCGTVSILEPLKWIKNKSNITETFKKEGPMIHEFTHYILDYITRGNTPVWFSEGMSLYEEYIANGVEWAKNRKYDTYYSIEELNDKFYELNEIKAYKQSFLIVRYMYEKYGRENMNKLIEELGRGKSMEQTVEKIIGISIGELFDRVFYNN